MEDKWNLVIYVDCMNEENGLSTLKDQSIDLCLTDLPYNIDATVTKGMNYKEKRKDKVKIYSDKIGSYEKWCLARFKEIKRICKMTVFTCGKLNLHMWYKQYNFHLVTWLIKNSPSRGYVSKFIKSEPILFYGISKKINL